MAEIPVEKKSSMAWLWWLLLLAGLAALLWWAFAANDVDGDLEEDLVDVDAVETTANDDMDVDNLPTNADGQTVLTGLAGLANIGNVIGRDVELVDVPVNRVVGDEAFTIGEGDNETLVMFDEYPTPNTPMEGHVDVNPGSNVTLIGNVRAMPDVLPESVVEDINTDAAAMIFATSVETVE